MEGVDLIGVPAYLYDAFTNSYTEIPQDGTLEYSFLVDIINPATEANDRFSIVFSISTLSTSNNYLQEIKLYPNPSKNGAFYLEIPSEINNLDITIYDVVGTRLYHKFGFNNSPRMTIGKDLNFSSGTYFVKLNSEGATTIKRLIIN